MSKRKSNADYKKKRTMRTIGIIFIIILGATFLTSMIGFASNGFTDSDPKSWVTSERNPDNLIKLDAYVIEDGQNDNKGIKAKVTDDGVIKLRGKATSDNLFTVANVTLEAGEYTISGIESTDDYGITVSGSGIGDVKSGGSSATFKIEVATSVAVRIYVNEGTTFIVPKDFEPCLVKGNVAQDMMS